MTVLKSAIMSFNITMQKVNRNEKILNDNLLRLNKMVVVEMNNMQTQIDSVMVLNENIQQIQRGLEECQHTLEILVDAFLHAQDGIIQPQFITITRLTHCGRVTQICVFTFQPCRTGDANLRF